MHDCECFSREALQNIQVETVLVCATILGPARYTPAAVMLWESKQSTQTLSCWESGGRNCGRRGINQPLVENMIKGLEAKQAEFSKPDPSSSVILGKLPLSVPWFILLWCGFNKSHPQALPKSLYGHKLTMTWKSSV